MATDPNLRDLFRSSGVPAGSAIDTAAVIRRSRRRRLPAQVGIGGIATLAVAGIAVVGVQGLGSANLASSSSDSAVTSAEESAPVDSAPEGASGFAPGAADSDLKRAPAERINLCGGGLAEVAPSATGLVLTPDFPDAPAGGAAVTGTVTLTNSGTETVAGYSAASPAITLSQNGVVLWHSNGPTIQLARDVSLAPGESMEYQATFTPVVCTVDDDLAESFGEDLPAAPAGDYQLSAAADISIDGAAELVTGPTQTVRID